MFLLLVNHTNRWEGREVLQRGRHMFPFQYKVPECVPCSFEGPDAHIRYSVQGIIIRYNGECISSQRIINVLREYDPRREPKDSAANSVSNLIKQLFKHQWYISPWNKGSSSIPLFKSHKSI